MSIQFVVETGTGASTSTSYATVAQFKQYWENRGTTFSEADAIIQAWINQATEFIDINYKFEGEIVYSTQALEWPRVWVINKSNIAVDSTKIPDEIINATCFLARQVKDGDLNVSDDGVKSVSYGPVSKTYSKSSSAREYPTVYKLLRNFLISGNTMQRVN